MLKPLLITTATLFSATFVSINTCQVANAATQFNSAQSDRQQLIASSRLNAKQQSEIKDIHQVLTKIYRGMNNHDIELIAETDATVGIREREFMKNFFKQLESRYTDISFEVKSIDLKELSSRKATIVVDQVTRVSRSGKSTDIGQLTTFVLTKSHGKWKVSDGGFAVKSMNRSH
jgi:archaellum component FlaC